MLRVARTAFIMLLLPALLAGCARYYKITDPASGKEYYTHDYIAARYNWNGALRFTDMQTGSDITLQSSEVKEVERDEAVLHTGNAAGRAPSTPW